jgi:tetratricopeptide (TPR) repeat protein
VEGALQLAQEALALANEAGDDEVASIALNTIGMARVYQGDAGGIEDLERSVERAKQAGSVFNHHSALNNLANILWNVGRIADGSACIREARALCERYGFTSALAWNDAELVYDADYRGDLEAVVAGATEFLARGADSVGYQDRAILTVRARALLARGQVEDALADAERALADLRTGADAQLVPYVLSITSRCLRAAGRAAEADELLTELLAGEPIEDLYELPLGLIELGRAEGYLALTEGKSGHLWQEAGRTAAAGELARASEMYAEIGAREAEAWAALLAAERGDTSRLDSALAYFEEQRATPYASRCRALMQASA